MLWLKGNRMGVRIHPTALVSPGAQLGENVEIGAFSVIESSVVIGKNSQIFHHVSITGNTMIGDECKIFPFASLGSAPQDLKYQGQKSFVCIGKKNIIRESVTINPGTEEGTTTEIGDSNLIMAYSHIAHNCIVGSNCVLANSATLAGHVTLGSRVIIGGLVAIHQFCRIGDFSIIGGCSKVVQDVPPYALCDGHPAFIYGLNLVGLRRAGINSETIKVLRRVYKILFFEGHTTKEGVEIVRSEFNSVPQIKQLIDFVTLSSRGICRNKSKNAEQLQES